MLFWSAPSLQAKSSTLSGSVISLIVIVDLTSLETLVASSLAFTVTVTLSPIAKTFE